MRTRTLATIILVAMAVIFCAGYAVGLNIYSKTVDAIGAISITDEVEVTDMSVKATALKVELSPNGQTQADIDYTVHLYLDDVDTMQDIVTWTGAEITAVTKKKLTFSPIDWGSVSDSYIEVTH